MVITFTTQTSIHMKNKNFPFNFIMNIFSLPNIYVQWESLENYIIPKNHSVWSFKVASNESIWALSTIDNFPPTNQTLQVYRFGNHGANWTTTVIPAAISTFGRDISPIDSMTIKKFITA